MAFSVTSSTTRSDPAAAVQDIIKCVRSLPASEIVIASVVPSAASLLINQLTRAGYAISEIQPNHNEVIKQVYPTMGIDRITSLAGSRKFAPNSAICVLDFGTATTLSVIDAEAAFLVA